MGNTYNLSTYAAEIAVSRDQTKETGVYRSMDALKKLCDLPKGVSSSWDLFMATVRRVPNEKFLGSRKVDASGALGDYEWMTYEETSKNAIKLGSFLIEKDLCPVQTYDDETFESAKKLRPLGLFITNRPEWFVTELGSASQRVALVPLYETLGEASMDYIIDLTKMSTIVISQSTFVPAMKAAGSSEYLKNFIVVDKLSAEERKTAQEAGINIIFWSDIMKSIPSLEPNPTANPDDINTLCFTSGTTGMPKGVLISHRNVVSCAHSTCTYGPLSKGEELGIGPNDYHISYLPLAHVFERLVCTAVYNVGGKIGCFSGNMLKLMDDVSALNPTVFVSVPRLFNRINDKITAGVDQKSYVVQSLFSWGLNSKINKFRSTATTKSSVWDTVVFGKFKGLLGNRLRFMISGGAPLDPIVHERIQACFCAPLLQGYGMSETFGPSFLCSQSDTVLGHVGGVYPSVEFKLESVPELNYFANEDIPKGELLIRGNSITAGYFRNAEANAEYFKGGWLHTGDICALLPSNGIKIIDRKKNLFKLAQGEYVAPEKIENSLSNSQLVNQIFVHGESQESFLVAVVVVDHDAAKLWASGNGRSPVIANLCKDKDFKIHLLKDLSNVASTAGLVGFEKIKNVHIIPDEFNVENNLLTPTSKLKRAVAQKHFSSELTAMYKEGMVQF